MVGKNAKHAVLLARKLIARKRKRLAYGGDADELIRPRPYNIDPVSFPKGKELPIGDLLPVTPSSQQQAPVKKEVKKEEIKDQGGNAYRPPSSGGGGDGVGNADANTPPFGNQQYSTPQTEQPSQQQQGNFFSDKLNDMANNPGRTAINAVAGFIPGVGPLNTISGLLGGPTIGGAIAGNKPQQAQPTPWDRTSPIDLNTVPGKGQGTTPGTGRGASAEGVTGIPASAFAQYGNVPSLANFQATPSQSIPSDIVALDKNADKTQQIKDIIAQQAAGQKSVPTPWAHAVVASETGGTFNPNLQAKGSSAKGVFQVLTGKTSPWAQFGGKGSAFDPAENARVGTSLMQYNIDLLKSKGLPVTAQNVYALQGMGPAGIAVLQNPDKPVSQTLSNYGKAVGPNSYMAGKTGQQLADWYGSKLSKNTKDFNPNQTLEEWQQQQQESSGTGIGQPAAPIGGKDTVAPSQGAPGGNTASPSSAPSAGSPGAPGPSGQSSSTSSSSSAAAPTEAAPSSVAPSSTTTTTTPTQTQEQTVDVDVVPSEQPATAVLGQVPATTVFDPTFNPDQTPTLTITPGRSQQPEPDTTVLVPTTKDPVQQPTWEKEEAEKDKAQPEPEPQPDQQQDEQQDQSPANNQADPSAAFGFGMGAFGNAPGAPGTSTNNAQNTNQDIDTVDPAGVPADAPATAFGFGIGAFGAAPDAPAATEAPGQPAPSQSRSMALPQPQEEPQEQPAPPPPPPEAPPDEADDDDDDDDDDGDDDGDGDGGGGDESTGGRIIGKNMRQRPKSFKVRHATMSKDSAHLRRALQLALKASKRGK